MEIHSFLVIDRWMGRWMDELAKIFALYITEKEPVYIKSLYKAIRKRLIP